MRLAIVLLLPLLALPARADLDPPDPTSSKSGGSRLRACSDISECTLIPRSCCGSCGAATASDSLAVNVNVLEELGRPECNGSGCPRCVELDAHQLIAMCVKKRCEVIKLDKTPYTPCSKDSDCITRSVDCCGGWPVAIRKDKADDLWKRTCEGVGCGRSMRPPLPPAICRKGRCAVSGRPGMTGE